MTQLRKDTFICLDCESTGLNVESDEIIELAAVKFNFDNNLEDIQTLIDPGVTIPEESIRIHNITQDMVAGKPKIQSYLPQFLKFIEGHTIVGHGIKFDIDIILNTAKRHCIPCKLSNQPFIDTLRLARLYGQTSVNSLEKLRQHFNIFTDGAHRAMNDVVVNIEVFKRLTSSFKTTQSLFERLKRPIPMKTMPLGKYKGRVFGEVPTVYLSWAVTQNFDKDLLFSIKVELKKRKKGNLFSQASNPFSTL